MLNDLNSRLTSGRAGKEGEQNRERGGDSHRHRALRCGLLEASDSSTFQV